MYCAVDIARAALAGTWAYIGAVVRSAEIRLRKLVKALVRLAKQPLTD
jgi:hypothetical protein